MAKGKLGALKLNPGTVGVVYTVPATCAFSVVNVGVVNIGTTDASFRLAFAMGPSPTEADWIEYDVVIEANGGVLERTGQILSPGERVMVYTNSGNIIVRVTGIEEIV